MNFTSILFFVVAALCFPVRTSAQFDADYLPRETFDRNSRELIEGLYAQLNDELNRFKPEERRKVTQLYRARTRYLAQLVREKAFVNDDSLNKAVESVLERILSHNEIEQKPVRTLIMRSSAVNAFCYGEGTFAVSIGLLSKMRNESQLAFVLAHELAHYQLGHIRSKSLRIAETNFESKFRSGLNRLFGSENVSAEEIHALRNLVYEGSRFTRANEEQADSLAFVFFRNATYDQQEALGLLDVLDSATVSKYPMGVNLFLPFDTEEYPFREYWLNKRLSLYNKKPSAVLIFSLDSIETHPDIALRKNKLIPYMDHEVTVSGEGLSDEFIQYITALADFELVESAYFNRQADRTLMTALQLLRKYPNNAYLVSMVGRVLIQMYEMKENAGLVTHLYLPNYTINYDGQLRLVNNFLHNINVKETGEVSFYFISSNFNAEAEEHYYLLWKISSLTYRNEVKKKTREDYRKKFPNGKYYKLMKEGLTFGQAMKILFP